MLQGDDFATIGIWRRRSVAVQHNAPINLRQIQQSSVISQFRAPWAHLLVRTAALVALALASLASPVFAQTAVTWSSTSDTTFSNGANWVNGAAPADNLTTNSANFNGASLADPVVTTSQSVAFLDFFNKSFTLSSTGGAVLTLGSLGIRQSGNFDLTVNMDVVLGVDQSWFSQTAGRFITMNGNVSGGFALSKSGSGTVLFSGTNTYTGTTTVTQGVLLFGKTSALYNGDTASWTAANLTVSSGTTLAFRVGGTGEFTTGNVTTLFTNLSTVSSNGLLSGSNLGFDTTNASGGTFTVTDTIANSTGTGGGAIGVNKLGSGTLVLTGTNTYTGKTTISAGTLSVSSIANRSSASALGAPTTIPNGTIAIGSTTSDGTLLYTGATASTNRVINLAGSTGGATLDSSGSGALTFTSAFTASSGTKTLTLTGSATGNTISGAIVNGSSGAVSLTKSGSGSWILSGTNLYTGTTTISAGTLVLDATGTFANSPTINLGTTASPGTLDVTATSSFSFGSGQTVSGVGTINLGAGKTVTISGTLAPGNSTGIINVTGNLTLASSATTNLEINGSIAGTGHDQINVSGLTTYGGALNFAFGSLVANGASLDLFGLSGSGSSGSFSSIVATGSYAGSFTNNSGSWSFSDGAQILTFSQSTGDLSFASAVPEPSTYAAFVGAVALGVAAYRRRKRT